MLEARIYRTAWSVVAVALIVVAFSLRDQAGAIGTTLPPSAFSGRNAYRNMIGLDRKFPDRRPGSAADDGLATKVATVMRRDGFATSITQATAATAEGTRTLRTVIASRPGLAGGSIVVVAGRDSSGPRSAADLSGTAVMLELARVLAGQTQHRPVMLISTSGSAGLAGATAVARRLGSGVDAVITLGDLASDGLRQPVIVPWSGAQQLAPPILKNTLRAALMAQAHIDTQAPGLLDQFAHLAFPLSLTEQAPFGAEGYPAAAISLAGERTGAAGPLTDGTRIGELGRAVLQTVNSLDGGPSLSPPSAYLVLRGEAVPAWAVRLLVLALIVPVLLTAIDGLARARRRGHRILRPLVWVLAGAAPFVLAALLVIAARLMGLLGATPPGPAGVGAVRLTGAGVLVLALVGCVLVGGCLASRWLLRSWRSPQPRRVRSSSARNSLANGSLIGAANSNTPDAGAGIAVLLVLCATALVVWVRNPFAAALTIPALHLWMWLLDPAVRVPRSLGALLIAVGLIPPALVLAFYMTSLALAPIDAVWNGALLIAAGYIGLVAVLQWSVVLACSTSVISITARRPRLRHRRPRQTPVTIRGPITYAGPGSLGGTGSALRR